MKRKIGISLFVVTILSILLSLPALAVVSVINNTYDDLNRLVRVIRDDTTIHYTYDDIGNILTKTVIQSPILSGNYESLVFDLTMDQPSSSQDIALTSNVGNDKNLNSKLTTHPLNRNHIYLR